jgi:hypothetical protein
MSGEKAGTQKQCKTHCPHGNGSMQSTLMTYGNTITERVKCCHCGAVGRRTSKEREVGIKGHGPHARQTIVEVEDLTWFDTSGAEAWHDWKILNGSADD